MRVLMKNVLFSRNFRVIFCVCVLCSMGVCLMGCGTPGETSAEVNRRHNNAIRTESLQMQDDVDALLMIEQPSKLSDKYTR